jgi:CRISPR-associated endonuclease/helicase Cas3
VSNVLLEALAFAEGRFLTIHPFYDFNGRVARMLLFALLYRLELPPVQLVPDDAQKPGYLAALSEADTCNWQPLVEIWRRRFGTREKE